MDKSQRSNNNVMGMGNAAQMTTIEINDDVPHPNNLEQNETYENEERFTFTIAGFNTKFNPKTFGAIILFAAIVVALGIFLLSPFENSIVRNIQTFVTIILIVAASLYTGIILITSAFWVYAFLNVVMVITVLQVYLGVTYEGQHECIYQR